MNKKVSFSLVLLMGISLLGCSPKTKNVVEYSLSEGILYSGTLMNGMPDGQGSIAYANGDSLDAYFVKGNPSGNVTFHRESDASVFNGTGSFFSGYSFHFTEGTLTFSNGQYYQGKFVDNLYEDTDARMSFHTVSLNVTTYDWVYQGGFHQGSASGQTGTVYFPEFFLEAPGLWFLNDVCMVTSHEIADNQDVHGKIRYSAGYYEGEGIFASGTFTPKGEGETVFDNDCHYVGDYKNGTYDGKGVFSWPNGTRYEGDFKNGSPDGCYGTLYYPVYQHQVEGLWYFSGTMQGFVKPQKGMGKGFILFGDKSSYEGDIYYDGNQGWYRKGEGIQDFSECNFSSEVAGGPAGLKLDKYVGAFDFDISLWIYGNGVFYFCDSQKNPVAWTKGFYSALTRVKDYEGSFSTLSLLPGYTPEMEVSYTPEITKVTTYQNKYHGRTEPQVLFAGDSYMEMWYSSFGIADYDADMATIDAINVGIGGTVFQQWFGWKDTLITPFSPKKIVLHLGFNDLHLGLTVDDTVATMETLVTALKASLPQTEIYLLTVEPSPTFRAFRSREATYNQALKAFAAEEGRVQVIDTASLFLNQDQPLSNLSTYFISDGVHLNSSGYALWVEYIRSQLAL